MPITPIFRDRANGSNFVFIATLVGARGRKDCQHRIGIKPFHAFD
jgi:hypothetical protein